RRPSAPEQGGSYWGFGSCALGPGAKRGPTTLAQVIVELAIRKDKEKPLPNRHGTTALVAVKEGGV
ncbi:MAG: hypothetical protein V3U81_01605, partial [Candidatus Binatia bacterium]